MAKYLKIIFVFSYFLLSQRSYAQIQAVKFEQLDSLQKMERRPVVVFLHTSWCKYCGSMKNTTFKNKDVQALLTQKFYFVSLDIEDKGDISFRGFTFKYKPTGANTGVHELAEQLGTINGQIAYPGICFLNADYEIIHQQEGYIPPKEFLFVLSRLESAMPE